MSSDNKKDDAPITHVLVLFVSLLGFALVALIGYMKFDSFPIEDRVVHTSMETFDAKLHYGDDHDVIFHDGGKIVKKHVNDGDRVETGDLLFEYINHTQGDSSSDDLVKITARKSGVIDNIMIDEGAFYAPATMIAKITELPRLNVQINNESLEIAIHFLDSARLIWHHVSGDIVIADMEALYNKNSFVSRNQNSTHFNVPIHKEIPSFMNNQSVDVTLDLGLEPEPISLPTRALKNENGKVFVLVSNEENKDNTDKLEVDAIKINNNTSIVLFKDAITASQYTKVIMD